ncbi:hypothetical protein OA90_14010 [Labrenzia sp. OB1]|nr:hypothetical protein OA90_14010 [Labrenzia sp. OB1]
MTTDVSAGALAAGNGALQGAGQKQGKAPGGAGFAAELGAADAGRGPDASGALPGKGAQGVEAVADTVPGIKAGPDAPRVEDMLQLPVGEVAADPLPVDGQEILSGASGEVADAATDESLPTDDAIANGSEPLPGAGLPGLAANTPLPAGDAALARANSIVGPVSGPAGTESSGLAGGSPQGSGGAAGGPGQVPANASGSGSFGDVLASATAGAAPAGSVERRWQSELPRELRAQASVAPQSSAPVRQEPGTAGVVADALTARPGNETGAGEQVKGPGLPTGPSTAGQDVTLSGGRSQTFSAGKAGEGTAQGLQSGEVAEAGLAAKSGVTAQNRSGDGPVPLQSPAAGAGARRTGEAGLSEALSGDEAAGLKGAADTKSPTVADRIADRATGGQSATDASSRPEARLAGANAAASTAAGLPSTAFTMAGGDAELIVNGADLSLTGEGGAATVRGGDLSGAMRTDSLQAPNQSQSGHVATQVAAEIARNLKNGNTRFQMRFDPPELGRVEVNMKVSSDGSVHAHLIVDRPETLDMFLRDQRGLEKALEAAGLNPDSENMQFSLKQDGGREFASGDDRQDQGPEGGQEQAVGTAAEIDPMVEEIVRMTLAEQRGGLDLKI